MPCGAPGQPQLGGRRLAWRGQESSSRAQLTPGVCSFAAYRCGSQQGWSDTFSFQTLRNGSDWSPRFVIYGDMGLVNPQSLPRLIKDTENGMYDVLLHVGTIGAGLLGPGV